MEESDTIITLIGTKLAKIGNEFIFRGTAKDCEPCKLNRTCLGLNIGSKYRINSIRKGGKLECFIHDCGVCAVEVIETPIRMSIEARKAIRGSKIVYEPVACNYSSCENYGICHPSGLIRGDKFTVVEVAGEMPGHCRRGYSLKVAEVKRSERS
ncbi:hypothetical protein ANME2D_00682 [Candidatus Methanoperedens nitroreducens]|uniref:UPF0179 protein ANME2D_00682 n=1 Tax=Candidatus Methanoperedens nitratireducens TaxID=1392998 RepID=A0A062V3F0_9EURY|nr:UPF0179 family protein [Candidatus Methanoperedens nitroreducens]KCZ73611.1 hypothetical protein ANME2D_00682 [Candidatus Methanoperedens nitroreducens]MDJ1422427.1 UPF0179 family protein [Candidatus Methanoperedens sp.]